LTSAKASVPTIRGEISSSWERKESTFSLNVEIPVNSMAFVSIPKLGNDDVSISENGKVVWADHKFKKGQEGIVKAIEDNDYISIKVGSGKYSFQLIQGN
jgi:hypothetical protein